jgi:hypothetical protein
MGVSRKDAAQNGVLQCLGADGDEMCEIHAVFGDTEWRNV